MSQESLPAPPKRRKHLWMLALIITVICATSILIFVMAERASAAPIARPTPVAQVTRPVYRPTPIQTAQPSRTSRRSEQRTSRYDEYRAERCLEHPGWCAVPTVRPTRSAR